MSGIVREIFGVLTGFTVEQAGDFVLIKIGIDDLMKKILGMSQLHELGVEYVVDGKYVVFKVPVQGLGEEALKKIGVGQETP